MYHLDDLELKVRAVYRSTLPAAERSTSAAFFERRVNLKPAWRRDAQDGDPARGCFLEVRADELFVWGLYLRHFPVFSPQDGKEVILDSWRKLQLLKQQSKDRSLWDDQRLYTLYYRTTMAPKRRRIKSYGELLTDIGQDEAVVALWTRPITYARDISYLQQKKNVRDW